MPQRRMDLGSTLLLLLLLANSAVVMYACNEVNGIPAVASADLAARLHSWGFDGYRTTDGDGVGGLYARNR